MAIDNFVAILLPAYDSIKHPLQRKYAKWIHVIRNYKTRGAF